MKILVGDIGGTNARFAVITVDDTLDGVARGPNDHMRWELLAEATLPSRRFPSLGDALSTFIEAHPGARGATEACFGIAGPVRGNSCETTNLPWVIDGDQLANQLGIAHVPLLNDLEAAAWGLGVLGANGVRTLREGQAGAEGNRAMLAPGTGLGEAGLYWDGEMHHPFATEGGHADFGPANEQQVELWHYMTRRYGHVSWERVVSGPGLVSLYRFLLEQEGVAEPAWLEHELQEGDAPAAISNGARADNCEYCRAALDLFFELLGAEAGNLALRTLATGGVFLAGGIVPKLLSDLQDSPFLTTFTAKGRFRPLLESIPVKAVIDDRLALWGAAARAVQKNGTSCIEPVHLRLSAM